MMYARWATIEELKSRLVALNTNTDVKKSGIPMMYDDEKLYINDNENHTIVIGTTGSGKTQTTLLPQARLAIKAGESLIINDTKMEVYNEISGEAKKQGYNIIVIDLDNISVGNCFNPLTLPYKLYKNGEQDKALEILDRVARYICNSENPNVDPFWDNMASNYFVSLALYLFDNAKEDEINFNGIYKLCRKTDELKNYLDKIDKLSPIYINLSGILLAPPETKESILSVFSQKLGLFISKENLSRLLANTDFDISSIQKEKTALFIISTGKGYANKLIPLIIDECYYAITMTDDKSRRLNILLDEFQNLSPIYEFSNMLVNSRYINVRFTIYLRSFLELNNVYGKNSTVKMAFGNIVYLLANDIETLEEISNLCGKRNSTEPLITIEELKLLDEFEAIILMPRISPIRTKLLPDYKMDFGFDKKVVEIPKMTKNK
ncbi:MAG: type IV secretory system conjugative DNA transfer family protein [Bacilli bacterium]|nr:type IV secretory system conjugative DNA transfer family protein [Bacilli bacterium]